MNTTTIHYRVSFSEGRSGWLTPDGYSGYNKRASMCINGEIQHSEVYGLDQCILHIAEYKGTQDEYTESRQKETLIIQKITTITEEINYTPIEAIINTKYDIKTISETD